MCFKNDTQYNLAIRIYSPFFQPVGDKHNLLTAIDKILYDLVTVSTISRT